jgi:hypothetical protein
MLIKHCRGNHEVKNSISVVEQARWVHQVFVYSRENRCLQDLPHNRPDPTNAYEMNRTIDYFTLNQSWILSENIHEWVRDNGHQNDASSPSDKMKPLW